jgi:hypothetical protein
MRLSLILFVTLFVSSCQAGGGARAPEALTFSQPGALGMFDPSLRGDPNGQTLWMSYSSGASDFTISTRLARSDDQGATFQDQGVVVFQGNVTPLPPPTNSGIWQYEVSNLVYDQDAPAGEKWKLMAFRYLVAGGSHLYQHSWMALKTSATIPSGWSSERKLFTGAGYDAADDNSIIGPPEIPLDQLAGPGGTKPLSDCAAFTEPGFLSKAGALYLAIGCATGGPSDRIVLLQLSHPAETWSYVGVLVTNADSPAGFTGLSAAELTSVRGTDYLIVSPAASSGGYQGCLVYQFASLAAAEIERQNGKPVLINAIPSTGAFNNGACSYDPLATQSGILYLNQTQAPASPIQIFKSFLNL